MGAAERVEEELVIAPQAGPQTKLLMSAATITFFGGAARGGKRLPLTTRIPTPTGWTTMGELSVGDVVLSAEGEPTIVTWCSPVEEHPDSWQLEFDDGEIVVCDAEHQWVTITRAEQIAAHKASADWRARRRAIRPSRAKVGAKSAKFVSSLTARNRARGEAHTPKEFPARGVVRTTAQIVETLLVRGRTNHAIVNAAPLRLPEGVVELDPYLLGTWLGDGTTTNGGITSADEQTFQAFVDAGFSLGARQRQAGNRASTRNVLGLVGVLRRIGVLGNKHIPIEYLRASFEQRLALLQGLCDTDGHAVRGKGSVEFTTTRRELRDGMVELLATLGIKPSVREGRATLNGRDISAKWRIQFWTDLPCFRLERKLRVQKRSGFRGCHDRRYIVAARRAAQVPMRCIAVDAPSRTYLVGERMIPTHNTYAALLALARWFQIARYVGILFRREAVDLTGGESAWSQSQRIMGALGGKARQSPVLEWRWPEHGSSIEMRHLQNDGDELAHQGKAYACIVFEEVTHFLESQFWYLVSRLYSESGVTPHMIATLNPDPESWVWPIVEWWIDPESRLPIPERDGVLRWFCRRDDDTLDWGDDAESVAQRNPGKKPMSVTFIAARFADNAIGAANDPDYEGRLDSLLSVDRDRLKFGRWTKAAKSGGYFRDEWFPRIALAPKPLRAVRCWDLAATEVSEHSKDPDWTRGGLLQRYSTAPRMLMPGQKPPEDAFVIADLESLRAGPAEVDALVERVAERDGRSVEVALWQDPGQAGKAQARAFVAKLANRGYTVHTVLASQNKEAYARVWAPLVRDGRVSVVDASWTNGLMSRLEAFPGGRFKDDVDAFSLGFQVLTTSAPVKSFRVGGL